MSDSLRADGNCGRMVFYLWPFFERVVAHNERAAIRDFDQVTGCTFRTINDRAASNFRAQSPRFDRVSLPLQSYNRAELEKMTNGPSWQSGNAKAMLAKMKRGEKLRESYEAPVAVWQFGTNLTLVGLSGEVVVDYVTLLEDAIGPLQLWTAAYCNDVFGYFPSARVLKQGGYECRGLYTEPGFFTPAAQDILVAKVRELADR